MAASFPFRTGYDRLNLEPYSPSTVPRREQKGKSAVPKRSVLIPPHSLEAEQAVLGGLMLSPEAFDKIADKISDADFYRREHQLIFRAIADLAAKSQPHDAVTLGEWFEAHNIAEIVGGSRYVMELANSTPSAANILAYATIVRDRAALRRLIDLSSEVAGAAFNPEGRAPNEIVALAEQRLGQIAEAGQRAGQGFTHARAAAKEAFEQLQKRFESGSAVTGIATGYRELDTLTAGLQPGDLIIVAARPSMGKTALATCFAEHAALAGDRKAVAFFSMEMSSPQIALRLISSLGRIDQQRMRTGNLEEEDWPKVTHAIELISSAKILIDDTPALSPTELRARARRLKREHDLGLVVIDYMQLMQVPGTKENRATEIAEISRALKALAKELNVPVVALSQLNRALEQRADKRPVMADLRESGSIEQDADVIIFVYREEYYDRDSPEKGIAEIIIGKQRNGPTGTVRLAFRGDLVRFDELRESA